MVQALEEKIEKAEADVIAAKKKYDQATANLKELLDKREASALILSDALKEITY